MTKIATKASVTTDANPVKMRRLQKADCLVCFVFIGISYGRGSGVGCVLGVTFGLAVGVGLGVGVRVAVGVAVPVGVVVGVWVRQLPDEKLSPAFRDGRKPTAFR